MNLSRDEIRRAASLFGYNNIVNPPHVIMDHSSIDDTFWYAIESTHRKEMHDRMIKQNEEKKQKGLFELMVNRLDSE